MAKTAAQFRTTWNDLVREQTMLTKRTKAVSVPEARKAIYRRRLLELNSLIPQARSRFFKKLAEEKEAKKQAGKDAAKAARQAKRTAK